MNEPKGPGREVIAARQLVEEWSRKVVDKKLRTYDSPREAYVAFAEWLYARVTPVQGPYGNAFEMEVFRKILPRFVPVFPDTFDFGFESNDDCGLHGPASSFLIW